MALGGGDKLARSGMRVIVRKIRNQKVLEAQMGQVKMSSKDSGSTRSKKFGGSNSHC